MVRYHERGAQVELASAECEELVKTGTEELHDEDVEVALDAEMEDIWDPGYQLVPHLLEPKSRLYTFAS